MTPSFCIRGSRRAWPGLLAGVLALLALACAPASTPTSSGVAPPAAATLAPGPGAGPTGGAPIQASPAAPRPTVGSQAGERVPDFALKLAGGTQVTSQELLVQHRPTFLFFFATW